VTRPTPRSADLDPDLVLRAYAMGVFPMAEHRDEASVFWVEPRQRAILPLDGFHLSRSLRKTIVSDRFRITADAAFDQVIALCAEPVPGRPDTWINPAIEKVFGELHRRGFAHSIEVWEGERLAGGLYGLALGRAFFGESMVSRARDASKVAIAALVARLRLGGFMLLDCQFMTEHLASLGAVEVPRETYLSMLSDALGEGAAGLATGAAGVSADFGALDALGLAPPGRASDPLAPASTTSPPVSGKVIAQLLTQTS
jgi:leucyl/phenylalanyl-tRNA---protein transferase